MKNEGKKKKAERDRLKKEIEKKQIRYKWSIKDRIRRKKEGKKRDKTDFLK
jgi:hypothetical protein